MKTSRRKFIGITTAAVAGGSIAASAMGSVNASEEWPVVHQVFFWLKNPDTMADRNKLIAGLKTLAKIPVVKKLRVGVVAATEKRDVVESSWSISELMYFATLADQAAYQTHPIHLEFIKSCSHLWDKVVVYDSTSV